MKSQTYATGESDCEGNPLRACKSHDGIIEKAEQLKEDKINKTLNEAKDKLQEVESIAYDDHTWTAKAQEHKEWSENHCWL
ncbi:MAG: hypothetical protein GF411_14045 [Candidatus Lokiarchaeota archaeon]|nr:hypothetical protein [Candidatus Lokiarchaeota archaeon]